MLEEIRVALPGIELLFGFLLVLPFSERFGALDASQRALYLVCLIVTAASTALFIAPTAQHRLGFRNADKERLLVRATRQVIGGLILVSLAVSLAVYLIVWFIVGRRSAWAITIPLALWFVAWWFLIPPFWKRGSRHPAADR